MLVSLVVVALALLSAASPVPKDVYGTGKCSSIARRQEWRTLGPAEKASYTKAVKCLLTKPSQFKDAPVHRLYDDFTYLHATETYKVHFTANFLPWHRWLLYLYQRALNGCGYDGVQPYWAWDEDWEDIFKSPIWSTDNETGFGGTGRGAVDESRHARAVIDGAFANLQLDFPNTHTLSRNFSTPPTFGGPFEGPFGRDTYSPSGIARINAADKYTDFKMRLEGDNPFIYTGKANNMLGPHGTVHLAVGSDMGSLPFPANDPIFFMHHANVDRLWAKWQDLKPDERIKPVLGTAYAGNLVQNQTDNGARLSDPLPFLGLSYVTVQGQLDTRAPPLCYEYAS